MAGIKAGQQELLFLQRLMGEPIRLTLSDSRVIEGDLIAVDGNKNLLLARATVMSTGDASVDETDPDLAEASPQLQRESKPFIGITAINTGKVNKMEVPSWTLESTKRGGES